MYPRESDVIIYNPSINIEETRRYTSPRQITEGFYGGDGHYDAMFARLVSSGEITPEQFPRALDFFAGDGSWARRFVENGWDPQNVTCIDIARTETPLVRQAKWIYMDLAKLVDYIKAGWVPGEAEVHRHKWDLVAACYGVMQGNMADNASETLLAQFFVRKRGAMIVQGDFSIKRDGRLPR